MRLHTNSTEPPQWCSAYTHKPQIYHKPIENRQLHEHSDQETEEARTDPRQGCQPIASRYGKYIQREERKEEEDRGPIHRRGRGEDERDVFEMKNGENDISIKV